MADDNCGTCKFFRSVEDPAGGGECRRFPPHIHPDTETGDVLIAVWPVVNSMYYSSDPDWCGEYQSATAPDTTRQLARRFSPGEWEIVTQAVEANLAVLGGMATGVHCARCGRGVTPITQGGPPRLVHVLLGSQCAYLDPTKKVWVNGCTEPTGITQL